MSSESKMDTKTLENFTGNASLSFSPSHQKNDVSKHPANPTYGRQVSKEATRNHLENSRQSDVLGCKTDRHLVVIQKQNISWVLREAILSYIHTFLWSLTRDYFLGKKLRISGLRLFPRTLAKKKLKEEKKSLRLKRWAANPTGFAPVPNIWTIRGLVVSS